MSLNNDRKKKLRAIGHNLSPIILIGNNGVSVALLTELERALEDHELIKIKCLSDEREVRKALIAEACAKSGAELVQTIGKIALLYRAAKEPDPKLSNLLRQK